MVTVLAMNIRNQGNLSLMLVIEGYRARRSSPFQVVSDLVLIIDNCSLIVMVIVSLNSSRV